MLVPSDRVSSSPSAALRDPRDRATRRPRCRSRGACSRARALRGERGRPAASDGSPRARATARVRTAAVNQRRSDPRGSRCGDGPIRHRRRWNVRPDQWRPASPSGRMDWPSVVFSSSTHPVVEPLATLLNARNVLVSLAPRATRISSAASREPSAPGAVKSAPPHERSAYRPPKRHRHAPYPCHARSHRSRRAW